jgi:c-di-GMP-binding flagellar brake protein YcgR
MKSETPSNAESLSDIEENLERFQIYSRMEIGLIFRGAKASRQLLQINFPNSLETAITTILDVDTKNSLLLLDMPSDSAQSDLALKSDSLRFEGLHERIRISFSTGRASSVSFEGKPVLLVPFPGRLTRMQRRNHFRVPISGSRLIIPVNIDGNVYRSVSTIVDLSSGGACVIDTSKKIDTTEGVIYTDCILELSKNQPQIVSLQVRNFIHMPNSTSNSTQYRIGCQFINLSSSVEASIQRFITRVETQRIPTR